MAAKASIRARLRYRIDKFLDRFPPLLKLVYFLRGLTVDRGQRSNYLFDSLKLAFSTVFPGRRFDYFVSPDGRTAGARERDLGISLTISRGMFTDYKLFEDGEMLDRFPLIEKALFAAIKRVQELELPGARKQPLSAKVVIFALPRTGSNALAEILRLHPDLEVAVEPFNPHFSDWGKMDLLSQVTDRSTLDWALERLFTKFNGFKHLAYQLPWHLNQQILERPCRRILLYRRNAFEAVLSNQIANQTKDWLNERRHLENRSIEPLDPQAMQNEMAHYKKTYTGYLEFVQTEELDYFELCYESLFSVPESEQWTLLERIFDYIGVAQPDEKAREKMSRYLIRSSPRFVRGKELYGKVPNYLSLRETFDHPEHSAWTPTVKHHTVDNFSALNIVHGKPLGCRFVFVICFRNQEKKIERCLSSILQQEGDYDWGIAVVDDGSTDSSLEIVTSLLRDAPVPTVVVSNEDRKFYSRNLYNAVCHLIVEPESIVIEVDGDDYLAGPGVLKRLDRAYGSGAVRTMGSFGIDAAEHYFFGTPKANFTQPWDFDQCTSWMHLKTYRKWLFEKVPLPYFKERGTDEWLKMGEDMVVHPKMIELAGAGNRYIPDTLYVYDYSGDSHDCKDPSQAHYKLVKLYRLPRGQYLRALRAELEGTEFDAGLSPHKGKFAWLYQ